MRIVLGLQLVAVAAAMTASARAQPYPLPPGSYQRQCTDIRMEGQFLSAYCRGAGGAGRSSINVLSCSTEIFVDPSGALTCVGPGGGAPPALGAGPPGYGYGGPREAPGGSFAPDRGYGRGDGRGWGAALYARRNWRGAAVRIEGPTPNLGSTGINDRVRSIRLEPGSGPWLVCSDADYRGRCTTIGQSIPDTRDIGMGDQISSLRPR